MKASRTGLVPRVLPVARETGRVPDSTGAVPAGREGSREWAAHRAQPLHGEKVLEPPYLGLCAGVAGVSKLCWRWGRHARWGERPEASSPMPVHPPPVAPAPGGRPAFAVERRAASQLRQQSSGLQPLWACSQRGQREPGPGGSPGCLLGLSPGQGSQGQASLSGAAYPALSCGAVTPLAGRPGCKVPQRVGCWGRLGPRCNGPEGRRPG